MPTILDCQPPTEAILHDARVLSAGEFPLRADGEPYPSTRVRVAYEGRLPAEVLADLPLHEPFEGLDFHTGRVEDFANPVGQALVTALREDPEGFAARRCPVVLVAAAAEPVAGAGPARRRLNAVALEAGRQTWAIVRAARAGAGSRRPPALDRAWVQARVVIFADAPSLETDGAERRDPSGERCWAMDQEWEWRTRVNRGLHRADPSLGLLENLDESVPGYFRPLAPSLLYALTAAVLPASLSPGCYTYDWVPRRQICAEARAWAARPEREGTPPCLRLWPDLPNARAWGPDRWLALRLACTSLVPEVWTLAGRLVRRPALVAATPAAADQVDARLHLEPGEPAARTEVLFPLLAAYAGLVERTRAGRTWLLETLSPAEEEEILSAFLALLASAGGDLEALLEVDQPFTTLENLGRRLARARHQPRRSRR